MYFKQICRYNAEWARFEDPPVYATASEDDKHKFCPCCVRNHEAVEVRIEMCKGEVHSISSQCYNEKLYNEYAWVKKCINCHIGQKWP